MGLESIELRADVGHIVRALMSVVCSKSSSHVPLLCLKLNWNGYNAFAFLAGRRSNRRGRLKFTVGNGKGFPLTRLRNRRPRLRFRMRIDVAPNDRQKWLGCHDDDRA